MSEKDLKGKYSGSVTGDVTLTNATPSANGELGYDPVQGFLGYHNGAVGPIGGGNTSWETSDAGNNQITFNAGSRIVNSVVTTIASDITTNSTPVAITNDTLTTLDSSNGMLYAASASVRVFIFYDIINEEFVGIGNSTETSDYTWDYRNNNSNFNINLSQYVPTGYVDVSASGNPGTLTFTITNWPVQAWTTFASVAAAEEWQDFSPTLSNDTNVTTQGFRYRRVGNSVEFYARFNVTGAGAGTTFDFTLPINISTSLTSQSLGAASVRTETGASNELVGNCLYDSSRSAAIIIIDGGLLQGSSLGAGGIIRVEGSYEISEADGFNPISVGFPNLSDLVRIKKLSADVTTNGVMTDLTTTLEIGKTYEVHANFLTFPIGGDSQIGISARHDGNTLFLVVGGNSTSGDGLQASQATGTYIFTATANTLTFESSSIGAGGNISVDSYVIIKEVPQAGTAVLIPKTVYYENNKLVAAAGTDWAGTVSQNGTSSVIERGSNVNGQYVKFADGTMICTKQTSVTTAVSTPTGSMFWSGSGINPGTTAATFVTIEGRNFNIDSTTDTAAIVAYSTGASINNFGNFYHLSERSRSSQNYTYFFTVSGRWY